VMVFLSILILITNYKITNYRSFTAYR
jgi:hypothetical protein